MEKPEVLGTSFAGYATACATVGGVAAALMAFINSGAAASWPVIFAICNFPAAGAFMAGELLAL